MKTKLFIITLLALLVAGCTLEPIPESEKERGKLVTITVTTPSETRVAYTDSDIPGIGGTLSWQTGDRLTLAGYGNKGEFLGTTEFRHKKGNDFEGEEIMGAVAYKAFYPFCPLDEHGIEQPLYPNFYRQIQTGNGTTGHLKDRMLLFDEDANPIGQTFNLVLKNSIFKFNLNNVPADLGTISNLIWRVETTSGVFKSMTLFISSLTHSSASNPITAYLAFDPAVMKIAENGKVHIKLIGNKTYEWDATVADGKIFTAGNRYRGTVTNNWTEQVGEINPLNYVAEYNVNNAGNGFVTDLTACNVSGYFNWADAADRFHDRNDIPGYHLPSFEEWTSVVPETGYNNCRFDHVSSSNNVYQVVIVRDEIFRLTSDFSTTDQNVSYALRFKGTNMLSAWKYELFNYNTNTCHIKITSRNVAPTVTISQVADPTFWSSGSGNDVVRYFPASGYKLSGTLTNNCKAGSFWSSTYQYTDYSNGMLFNHIFADSSTSYLTTSCANTVRLFTNP